VMIITAPLLANLVSKVQDEYIAECSLSANAL
jgi:hypothetical protein